MSIFDYMAHINLTKEEIGFSITPRQQDTTGPLADKGGLDPTFFAKRSDVVNS